MSADETPAQSMSGDAAMSAEQQGVDTSSSGAEGADAVRTGSSAELTEQRQQAAEEFVRAVGWAVPFDGGVQVGVTLWGLTFAWQGEQGEHVAVAHVARQLVVAAATAPRKSRRVREHRPDLSTHGLLAGPERDVSVPAPEETR